MSSLASVIECSVETETVDCPYPQVCYEVYANKSSTSLISATCDCLANFGYTGEQCDIKTTSTHLYLGWVCFLLAVTSLIWLWACVKLIPRLLCQKNDSKSRFALVGVIGLVGLTIHLVYLIISVIDPINGGASTRSDGVRVIPNFNALFIVLFLDISFVISNIVFISGVWYQLASRSQQLRLMRRDDNFVRNISLAFGIAVLVVSVGMFAGGQQTALYVVWGIVALICLIFWLVGAYHITKLLRDMGSSQEALVKTLVEIRNTALFTSASILIMLIGTMMQLGRAKAPGHEPQKLHEAPVWIFGLAFTNAGLTLAYTCQLAYAVRRLTSMDTLESSSKDNLTLGALATSPSKKEVLSANSSKVEDLGSNNNSKVEDSAVVSAPAPQF